MGKNGISGKYSRLEEAVIQTNRIVMTYDGEMIAPHFFAPSPPVLPGMGMRDIRI